MPTEEHTRIVRAVTGALEYATGKRSRTVLALPGEDTVAVRAGEFVVTVERKPEQPSRYEELVARGLIPRRRS